MLFRLDEKQLLTRFNFIWAFALIINVDSEVLKKHFYFYIFAICLLRRNIMSNHLTQAILDCISACDDCAIECGNCFSHMYKEASSNDCPACCIECAAICRLCSDAMARNSPFHKEICALCVQICEWCAEQCSEHDMEHCQKCAEACRRCVDTCRAIAA